MPGDGPVSSPRRPSPRAGRATRMPWRRALPASTGHGPRHMTGSPSATREALHLRARVNALVRDFFAQRGVLEVETPVLSRAGNTDPNIASFSLAYSGR